MKVSEKQEHEFIDQLDDLFKAYSEIIEIPSMMYLALQTIASISMATTATPEKTIISLTTMLINSLSLTLCTCEGEE